jgi:outer membrane protein assembly factor BamD
VGILFKKQSVVALLALALAGCATGEVNEADPGALYSDAEEEIKNDHYQLAVDKLRVVRNKFPYSKFAVDALLRIADVYFLQESFEEAAVGYEAFRDLYPKHEKTPYAMFRVGKSYFSDIPSPVARDQSAGVRSLDAYNEFLRRYPKAAEADEARKDVAEIRRFLAEKEFYIAEFYYKRKFYAAAKARLEKMIQGYSDTPTVERAKTMLAAIGTKSSGDGR